ncbi:MAG TPA: hypothetical protein VFA18_07975 [Gemmataceae bacterium]|nr:hypothetical protein [Gemmataceae bacterium]
MFGPRRYAIIGVLPDREQTHKACADLTQAGFRPDQIETVIRDEYRLDDPTYIAPPHVQVARVAVAWTLVGAFLGCLFGILATNSASQGLLGDSSLASIFGAALGTLVGAVLVGFIAWALVEAVEGFYAQEVRAGRTVVLIHDDCRFDEAAEILRRQRAYGVKRISRN